MQKLCFFFILAIIANEAVGMSFRRKRQSDDNEENNLEDRYGWNRDRPRQRPPWSGQQQWPNQNQGGQQWPNQNQGGQQWPNQNQGGQEWPNQNQGGQEWPNQNQGGQEWPNQNQGGQQQPTTVRPNGNGSTTQSATVDTCIRNCPVTAEYNPVCGSNGRTYPNPGSLSCAQQCGVNVNLARQSPCPTTTTTAAPSS